MRLRGSRGASLQKSPGLLCRLMPAWARALEEAVAREWEEVAARVWEEAVAREWEEVAVRALEEAVTRAWEEVAVREWEEEVRDSEGRYSHHGRRWHG